MKIAHLLIVILLSVFTTAYGSNSKTNIDSLKIVLIKTRASENSMKIIKVAKKLTNAYRSERNFEASLEYYLLTFHEAEKLESDTLIARSLYDLGFANAELGRYEAAITYCLHSMELCDKNKWAKLWLKNIRRISGCYVAIGDYEQSYVYLLAALHKLETLKDSTGMVPIYYEIGSNYFFQENFSEALKNYKIALSLPKNPKKEDYFKYDCYGAIGSTYARKEQIDSALVYNQKSLAMAEKLGYEIGIAHAKLNLAEDYISLKQHDKALAFYKQTLEISEQTNYIYGKIGCLTGMGTLYSKLSQHSKAISSLTEALAIAQENKVLQKDIYVAIADAYAKCGRTGEAFEYQKKFINLKDSLMDNQLHNRMKVLKINYEIQKSEREKEILMLKNEAEVHALQTTLLGGVGVLLFLLLALGFSRNKVQKNANKMLAQKNEEISSQNNRLAISNRDLAQFAFITSHDLKEPLRMIGGYSSLLNRRYKDVLDKDGQEFLGYISEAVDRMYNLLSDILNYSRINNEQETQYRKIDMEKLISELKQNLKATIEENNVELRIGELPNIQGNATQIYQLFQNLVSNAIKFKNSDTPKVFIKCESNETDYIFSVKDNGIGINKEYWENIFIPFKRLHSRAQYEGTGVGLSICQKVMEKHKGKIWIDSEPGLGTTFYFSFPKPSMQPEIQLNATPRNVAVSLQSA